MKQMKFIKKRGIELGFLDKVIYDLANGGKRTITKPLFLKDFTKENQQLIDLQQLSQKVVSKKKERIDRDIAYLKYGLDGEQNVYYELKNSFLPMLCLHNIRLEYDDYVAQLDFVIVTNKFIMVLETKKLSGDIEINQDGDFIRLIKNSVGKVVRKEGIYSPASQNERHVKILRELLVKAGIIKTFPIKSVVVVANPKTIVMKQKAPKEIQNHIYKYDQLIGMIKKELDDKTNERDMLEKFVYGVADFLIQHDKPLTTINYQAKYSLTDEDVKKEQGLNSASVRTSECVTEKNVNADIYEELKKYRLDSARKEGIRAYMVFNNEELNALIERNPKTKEELLQVKGFGNKKVDKYGESILRILNQS